MNIEVYNNNDSVSISVSESASVNVSNSNSEYDVDNISFLSSDESDEIIKPVKKATNSIDVINNIKSKIYPNKKNKDKYNKKDKNKDNDKEKNSSSSTESPVKDEKIDNIIKNGWDEDANTTINNWYSLFKQQSFIYQWVLERNKKISRKLIFASIISSSVLGIFSSFKLWNNSESFDTTSNVFLMLSNFSIALITSYSKTYDDDNRNELIRIYIDELDGLLGEISAQVIKSPVYRVNAGDFFRDHNYKYTKLITYIPNISLYELNESKKAYDEYRKHLINSV